jgi:hypothetical protein
MAPKMHAELQKLGFAVSERSISRYFRRVDHRGDPWEEFAGLSAEPP